MTDRCKKPPSHEYDTVIGRFGREISCTDNHRFSRSIYPYTGYRRAGEIPWNEMERNIP
jgi:hypothetical protein